MDNYTVTFVYDGDFDLPDNPEIRDREVPSMVLAKLEKHEFQLADFNLTQNYDEEYAEKYIDDPFLHRSVVEVKLKLTWDDLQSRERIYERCLNALRHHDLNLCRVYENENDKLGMLQSIICFEVKEQMSA